PDRRQQAGGPAPAQQQRRGRRGQQQRHPHRRLRAASHADQPQRRQRIDDQERQRQRPPARAAPPRQQHTGQRGGDRQHDQAQRHLQFANNAGDLQCRQHQQGERKRRVPQANPAAAEQLANRGRGWLWADQRSPSGDQPLSVGTFERLNVGDSSTISTASASPIVPQNSATMWLNSMLKK